MVKIIPVKTGLFEVKKDKYRWIYSFVEGVEVEVDEKVMKDIEAKGFIKPIKKIKIKES